MRTVQIGPDLRLVLQMATHREWGGGGGGEGGKEWARAQTLPE